MAPERLLGGPTINNPSKQSDVYSLAMTSFEVRSSAVSHPATRYNRPRYHQVLTGILPYDGGNTANVIADIRLGKRPSRPTDPRLQDPIWDTITTCWNDVPEQRYRLSVMHHVFSKYSRQEAQDVKPGNLNTRNDRKLTIADPSQVSKQGHSSVGDSSHGSLLSSSFCEIRSQKLRGVLVKWIRQALPPSPLFQSQG
jgi:hypothetical protein